MSHAQLYTAMCRCVGAKRDVEIKWHTALISLKQCLKSSEHFSRVKAKWLNLMLIYTKYMYICID